MENICKTENKKYNYEWYTPKYIIEGLGNKFDLDPCAPYHNWYTARKCYTKEDNGLLQEWEGRVFLNPPYKYPEIKQFITKLADHGNGIALLFSRCDNKVFFEQVFNRAHAVKFLKNRICFINPNGENMGRPNSGSVLIAYGETCANILKNSKIEGKYIKL